MTGPDKLICSPCILPPTVPSQRESCRRCSTPVWVSAAMLLRVVTREVEPICLRCADGVMQAPGATAIIHPDQVDELRALGIYGWSERTIAALNNAARRRERHARRKRLR